MQVIFKEEGSQIRIYLKVAVKITNDLEKSISSVMGWKEVKLVRENKLLKILG